LKPQYVNGSVRALCPDCGTVTTFEYKENTTDFGTIAPVNAPGRSRCWYKLLRCAGCGRGGMATITTPNGQQAVVGQLEEFLPNAIDRLAVPVSVPDGITAEFREAEDCASVGAWRGGASLLRSVLDKVLADNGYLSVDEKSKRHTIESRINDAARDGAITEARKVRAHTDIRAVANDILHGEWRVVTQDEFDTAHRYVQRILEDFYDDRPSVESVLRKAGRLRKGDGIETLAASG
jgi:hypothetical protein